MTRTPFITALAASALLLGACASGGGRHAAVPTRPTKAVNPTFDPKARTELDRYRAATRETDGELSLAQHPNGRLSDAQKSALISLAQANLGPEGSTFVIRTATGETNFGDAAQTARAAAEVMRSAGIAPSRILMDHFDAQGSGAPIKITYRTIEAVGPDCRKGWDDLSASGSNRVYGHFGCASTANLAAMIANPRDLQHPAADDPSDATRRGVVLGKYRKGEQTSTAKDEQASGAVSSSVK
jgi:pilus assembly protein CpaD